MALSPDTLMAHLPSQSSQTLLLHTTLLSPSTPVNTLVDSGATDNFINESLAMLAAMPQRLPLPICLTLFDSSSTSASDITHYVQTIFTFTNGQWQDLQLLVTHLHTSTPLILGLSWLRSINLALIGKISHSTLTAKPQNAQSPSPSMSPPWSVLPTTPTLLSNSVQSPLSHLSSIPDSVNSPKSSPPSSTAGPPECLSVISSASPTTPSTDQWNYNSLTVVFHPSPSFLALIFLPQPNWQLPAHISGPTLVFYALHS
ncbi:hypothetical protein C0993_009054 [Termitomyces sp. T159_Od127]|nr:hypothetical protein C0993_009054 [Termitomyces sp. T159_Od127]